MTVRWKPLLILSGLFLVIAVVGVIAIVSTLLPRGSADILPAARAERAAGRYENAEIHYKNALQKDGRNASIHEELAGLYAEWAERAPAEKKVDLQAQWNRELVDAARFDPKRVAPRRELLAEALKRDDASSCIYWAKDLLTLEPGDAQAHYVLAADGIEQRAPNIPEVARHLAALEAAKASAARVAWIKARLAQLTSDPGTMEETLARSRTLVLPADADPVDRMALLRLRALDARLTTDPEPLATRVQALQTEARALVAGPAVATPRIARLSQLLQQVQRALTQAASSADPKVQAALTALVKAIDQDVEAIFQKILAGPSQPELPMYLTYADHLRFRDHRAKCLEVVVQGLKSPMAAKASSAEVVNGLHAIAVEATLADVKDPDRFAKAAPHITELINSSFERFQGLGHLFQGAIELERSGVAGAATSQAEGQAPAADPASQPKLRASALNHLKIAATRMPDVAEAQARYGVALILSQEPGLGRQYLENAMRQGSLDAQYQVWAAWSMVQSGYPEEAEPIVENLQAQVAGGKLSRDLEGTLHLLRGEIHQARHSPAELQKAVAEYDKAVAGGKAPAASVQLRLAQIEVQLGRIDQALARLDAIRKAGQGGPGAEHLAVLALQEQGKPDVARTTLDRARRTYPESDELVGLDAALLTKADKPREADAVLAAFLEGHPDNLTVTLMRAQVLAEMLDRAKEARALLVRIAERTDNSAPLVQLALLDLKRKDYDAVAATIAKVRGRWKEAAAADLLDAQMALDRGETAAAQGHFSEALKKDPNNKLVQFWKAQLDSQTGSSSEAARTFEAIARERPVKEVDTGLSLMSAAQSALANLALANGDIDAAIHRFEDLRRGGEAGALGRSDRWQLIAAYNAKGQWPLAKKELAALLNDAKYPPSDDERVRAAYQYRMNHEEAAAEAQLDYVLKVNPANPSAVVTRSYLLAGAKKPDEAAALLNKAIAVLGEKKQKPPAVFYLMLAAVQSAAPPASEGAKHALDSIDQGLDAQPDSLELVQAKYRLLLATAGEKPALAFVEAKAKEQGGRSNDLFRRLLVEVYRERKRYADAERDLRRLVADHPKDPILAAGLVRLLTVQAVEAADHGDRDRERALNEATAALIAGCRGRFPGDLTFLQAECELAGRRGDLTRANAITQEMDRVAKNSTVGPLTRARLYAAQGKTPQVAAAYAEALDRNPRQLDVRILLGQARLKLGETDEALRQAKLVLEVDRNQPDALLLQARAMAGQPGPARQVAARQDEALRSLADSIAKNPRFVDAYHLSAEIHAMRHRRDQAIAALKAGVKAVPDDATGLSRLVELLSEPRDGAGKPSEADLSDAVAIAKAAGDRDAKGNVSLALAIGFHKAGALAQALPWASKAADQLDLPAVHLNYGDLLLSLAEASKDRAEAKGYFERAIGQYDLVLKGQANSVEAINNKAWILHTYFGESRQALALARGLADRVDPAVLPGEFFDTLGAIQEALGLSRDAEESFSKGLRKSPDHPVLNYHMGKLIAADPGRSTKAAGYLEKAKEGRGRLSPAMLADVNALMEKIARN